MNGSDLENLRLKARLVLHLSQPADALYAYYALYHDPQRTRLYVHEDAAGHADGFVAVCQTGQQLFQPTVVVRVPDDQLAMELLRQALVPGRPYYLIAAPDLQAAVTEVLNVERFELNHLYILELAMFRPIINVLVITEEGVGGLPRFVIRSREEVVAEAGLNWISPHFAEVFVHTEPPARGRGWGRAVLTACTTWVVRSGRQPLYVVNEANDPSMALAKTVGYVDTGTRELVGEGVCKEKL